MYLHSPAWFSNVWLISHSQWKLARLRIFIPLEFVTLYLPGSQCGTLAVARSPTMALRRFNFIKYNSFLHIWITRRPKKSTTQLFWSLCLNMKSIEISVADTPSWSPETKPGDPAAESVLPSKLWVANGLQEESLHGLSAHEHGPVCRWPKENGPRAVHIWPQRQEGSSAEVPEVF